MSFRALGFKGLGFWALGVRVWEFRVSGVSFCELRGSGFREYMLL